MSHVSTECDYPLGEAEMKQMAEEQRIPDEWAVSQVRACVLFTGFPSLIRSVLVTAPLPH